MTTVQVVENREVYFMSNSNNTTSGQKYMNSDYIQKVIDENESLSVDSTEKHKQFIDNNITMADNWMGQSGDGFLYAANKIAGYMEHTLAFFEVTKGLLGDYKLTFEDIDQELKNAPKITIN